ncbi:hypothetical protein ACWCYZ_14865 [Streptomyces virginiae]
MKTSTQHLTKDTGPAPPLTTINGVEVRVLTVIAAVFTAVSLAWTAYSVTDLMQAGKWGLLAAVSVDGLWGVVQYLDYKGIGGTRVHKAGWVALAAACGVLGYHGWEVHPVAAVAAALPPIVAKAAWLGDIHLRRDPTALTADQQAEINGLIRDSSYVAQKTAAETKRETAAEIARIEALGEVANARDRVTFDVWVERLNMREELELRRPLELGPASAGAEFLAAPDPAFPAPANKETPAASGGRQETRQEGRQEEPVTEWAVDSTETEYPLAPAVPATGTAFGFGAVLTANATSQEVPAVPARKPANTGRQEAAKRAARKPASTAAKTRRPMDEWVKVAAPVLAAETARLGRQPSGPEFAAAIDLAGLGAVSASTAKNIRAGITG